MQDQKCKAKCTGCEEEPKSESRGQAQCLKQENREELRITELQSKEESTWENDLGKWPEV